MNQDLKSALESMLDPEQNGWALTERQRDCARVLLGREPVELPKDTDALDLLGMQSRAARSLARKGGLVGGPARAAALTPERRAEIARKAADARWGKQS